MRSKMGAKSSRSERLCICRTWGLQISWEDHRFSRYITMNIYIYICPIYIYIPSSFSFRFHRCSIYIYTIYHPINWWLYIYGFITCVYIYTGWWLTYPSEKYMTSSVRMMIIPNWMESHKNHVPNHQPVYIYIYYHGHPMYISHEISSQCSWCSGMIMGYINPLVSTDYQ